MIYPIILCGGVGTRLWPLSRKSFPKQFSRLLNETTLFQDVCNRLNHVQMASPTIITNEKFRFTVMDELTEIGVEARAVILEPCPKNTAPAILACVFDIHQEDPDATIVVLPSDHSLKDTVSFHDVVLKANESIQPDEICNLGVKPTYAETGYGYLKIEKSAVDVLEMNRISEFVEKPSSETAEEMVQSGQYLWNTGIFLAKARHLINLYKELRADIYDCVQLAYSQGARDDYFFRLDSMCWDKCESISVDYAIMEGAKKLVAIPVSMVWSDLGNWRSVWLEADKDEDDVACFGDVVQIDCTNSLLRAETESTALVGVGLNNIFAIGMGDAVLIGDMSRAQSIGNVVEKMIALDIGQAEEFPKDHRPWGWYECLALGERFQVKRIVVKPGASLSLQSHNHRSEHWVVVQGTARVTIGSDVSLLTENMSVYVPLGELHRLENPGKIPLTLIEVQSGSYLDEDDIIRYEDEFGRL